MTKLTKQQGFTLIELLIVVSIIGLLAGVMVNVINVPRQRAVAYDGTKLSNLRSAAEAIEIYGAAEGEYPSDDGGDNNPLVADTDSADVAIYVKMWPSPTDSDAFEYFTYGTDFGIRVMLSTDEEDCYKYLSSLGTVSKCDNTCDLNSTCTQITMP